jgi:hypothetical protein
VVPFADVWERFDRFIAQREARDPSLSQIPPSATDRAAAATQYVLSAVVMFFLLAGLLDLTRNIWVVSAAATAASVIGVVCLRVKAVRRVALGVLVVAAGLAALVLYGTVRWVLTV